jgi:hypothetical protein
MYQCSNYSALVIVKHGLNTDHYVNIQYITVLRVQIILMRIRIRPLKKPDADPFLGSGSDHALYKFGHKMFLLKTGL